MIFWTVELRESWYEFIDSKDAIFWAGFEKVLTSENYVYNLILLRLNSRIYSYLT